ncbi:hypothetical protein BKA93DRAFT_217333 [Sparassis latifolia]
MVERPLGLSLPFFLHFPSFLTNVVLVYGRCAQISVLHICGFNINGRREYDRQLLSGIHCRPRGRMMCRLQTEVCQRAHAKQKRCGSTSEQDLQCT